MSEAQGEDFAALPGHAVLLVDVPPLEAWVRERTAFYDADWVSADPDFAHAHITVLAPCPPDEGLLRTVAASVEPFTYRLAKVETFSGGTIYLAPEPDDGFRQLHEAARAAAPDVRPYWGQFVPAPHLTLDRIGQGVDVASTRTLLGDTVPATARAERLWLTWWQAGNCRVLASAPLGAGR